MTTLEMVQLEDKVLRHTKEVYKEGFKIYRSAQKLYHSTAPSFINHSKDATTTEEFGGNDWTEIDYIGTATSTTIWKLIRPIILACNEKVSSLLKIFGVDEVEMSLFLTILSHCQRFLKIISTIRQAH